MPLGVLTFEPHPRSYFSPDAPSFRLMGSEARETRLAKLGVDILYELNFNANNFQGSMDKLKKVNLELEKRGDEISVLRDLSRLKYSLLLISQNELNEAIELLSKDFNFFNELKYEFLGDAQMESSNVLEAKKNYQIALDISSSEIHKELIKIKLSTCLLYTSPSPRDS